MSELTVSQAQLGRYSCRAFLDKPVSEALLNELLTKALNSPSGTNMQPWKIHVLTGEKKQLLIDSVRKELPNKLFGEGFDFKIFPDSKNDVLRNRREDCGERLYKVLDIARDDREGRIKQVSKNAEFFGAPVGIIITLDPCVADLQLVDCGIMMQSMMLLAQEIGLATCPQGFWTMWPDTVKRVLNTDNELVAVGLALGYPDESALINKVRQPREHLSDIVTFHS